MDTAHWRRQGSITSRCGRNIYRVIVLVSRTSVIMVESLQYRRNCTTKNGLLKSDNSKLCWQAINIRCDTHRKNISHSVFFCRTKKSNVHDGRLSAVKFIWKTDALLYFNVKIWINASGNNYAMTSSFEFTPLRKLFANNRQFKNIHHYSSRPRISIMVANFQSIYR